MIQYISRKELHLEKYDRCIDNAHNLRIYAYSWYLDCVTDNWGVLVQDDYKAVMPFPVRKKLGIHYIYQAPWIQQLGIFSKNKISEELIRNFISAIPKRYLLVDYFFNSGNVFSSKERTIRNNYILKLNKSFDEITLDFNQNRKRSLKKDFNDFKLDKNASGEDFLKLYGETDKNYKDHKDSLEKLRQLLKSNHPAVNIWMIFFEDKPIAGLVFLKDKKRLTYLVPVASEKAKKHSIPAFLITKLIGEFQNTSYILDFEGSMNNGVARFYKSFGAEKEIYYHFKSFF